MLREVDREVSWCMSVRYKLLRIILRDKNNNIRGRRIIILYRIKLPNKIKFVSGIEFRNKSKSKTTFMYSKVS